jgi:hypothetical protein
MSPDVALQPEDSTVLTAAFEPKVDGARISVEYIESTNQTGANIDPALELEGNDHETMNRAILLQSAPNDTVQKRYDAEHDQVVQKKI